MDTKVKSNFPAPANNTFTENDWNVLSRFWHAVAWSDEVTSEKPYGATLLDIKLVVFRGDNGEVTVASDRCPHRGASLSRGKMEDGKLTCAYHAFQFNQDGTCARIPAHPDMKIAAKMCLKSFPVIERYNIIWTCLNPEPKPLNPLPEWDVLNDPEIENIRVPGPNWKVSTARHCENFHDPAHFSVVHEGTFGAPEFNDVPAYKVERTETGLTHTNTFTQVEANTLETGGDQVAKIDYSYQFTFPFCNHVHLESESENFETYTVFDTASPVSAHETRVFLQVTRKKIENNPVTYEDVLEFEKTIVGQDIEIVEYLDPLELSLDLSEQVLIPADAWSIAYRRALADFGLTTGLNVKN